MRACVRAYVCVYMFLLGGLHLWHQTFTALACDLLEVQQCCYLLDIQQGLKVLACFRVCTVHETDGNQFFE